MTRDRQLARLTERWRRRHNERRSARETSGATRQAADPERVERALRLFPYRDMAPAAYVAGFGDAMRGYTYDDYTYPDPELQAWLDEVGRLLREGPMAPRP